ncbi:MAG: hypothetical protein HQM09_13705 [Candidatus Riflebacteria bacterium]|nr:hypothetical protein [Candidatus Riflebacteria bacterium]
MLKNPRTPQQKSPIPVILTGKKWAPSTEGSTKSGKNYGYIVVVIFCLAAFLLWRIFSGGAPTQAVITPIAAPQTASPTIASASVTDKAISTPLPDRIASATITEKTASATIQDKIASASIPGSITSTLLSDKIASAKIPDKTASTPIQVNIASMTIPPMVAVPVASHVMHVKTDNQDISGVPSLKRHSRLLMGLRPVLQADGWKITWVSRKKGVSCRNDAGSSLIIIPGNKRAILNGKPLYSSEKPLVTKNGQLFVSIELLNDILDGRLSIVGGRSSRELKVRLAATKTNAGTDMQASKNILSATRELSGITAVRRKGHLMISLRQVLEADGWTITWKDMKMGAMCNKGDSRVFAVAPGKIKSKLNDTTIRNRRTPIIHRKRLLVAATTLEKVLECRITLLSFSRKSHEAEIRLSGG